MDPIEINNGRSIPTYYLINLLEEKYQDCEFYFVLGSDLLPSFRRWEKGDTMLEMFKFIIIPREGFEDLDDSLYPNTYIKSDSKVEDAFSTSSTEVRNILQWSPFTSQGKHLKTKLGKRIYDFIIENSLYA